MARYIDADVLKQRIREKFDGLIERIEINSVINGQPTADVVEVVRCEDCRYFAHTVDWYECGFHDHYTMPNNYCSYGERREDAESVNTKN